MSNVIPIGGVTKLPIPPSRVLSAALDADMKDAIVIGWDADGTFYFASSTADGGDILWLLQLASKKLLEQG